jgi:hypothetical protein
MSDRKHADLWRELVDEAGEAEIDRAASVSVAEAEAELKAAGFDIAAERAKANAFVDAPRGEAASVTPKEATPPDPKAAPPDPETTRRKRPRPVVVWLAAAAAVAAAGGALYALDSGPDRVGTPPPPPTPTRRAPVPSADPLAVATELRRKAAAACDAKQWSACLAALDEARAVDPEGDGAPAVKALREKAAKMGF